MSDKLVKIYEMINKLVDERSKGNPVIAEMTKAKLTLKGIYPDKFDDKDYNSNIKILEKLIEIKQQWNAEEPKNGSCALKTAFSQKSTEEEVVLDIQSQFTSMEPKVIVYFSSSTFNQYRLSHLMEKGFKGSIVFGCSTAGERINEKLLTGSLVAMALCPNLIADAKVELIQNLHTASDFSSNINSAFKSFDSYFKKNTYNMDTKKYVGIVFMDGVSLKEEKIMDGIGNLTNVSFVGASAGDDFKFENTYVFTDGKAYTDSAIIILLKLQDKASCSVLKTQSLNILDKKLIANKVNTDTREVIEFNNMPATKAYAKAIGNCTIEELPEQFLNHPVGIVFENDKILVRSPHKINGTAISFCCNILKDMEVNLLESGDIIKETKSAIEEKISKSNGKIAGIMKFDCIHRRQEIEKKNLTKEYGQIFKDLPTVGFYSYGEAYIGHMNQTATMLVFEYDSRQSTSVKENTFLAGKINKLEEENKELKERLEQAIAELKDFNIVLENEIHERSKREERIAYLSYHDELTGLYNRRFYMENLKHVDIEDNLPISFIFGDINGLKQVNDTVGHDQGDDLIKKTANAIKKSCRDDDIIIRLGGDEFVVILPKTSKELSKKIVKRINKTTSQESVCGFPISISFGVDTKDNINQDISEISNSAEKFMYQNKNNLKNYFY